MMIPGPILFQADPSSEIIDVLKKGNPADVIP